MKDLKRVLIGDVVSDTNDKTIVVSVVRKFRHSRYKKYIQKSKKYHVHDADNIAKVGNTVSFIESRPYSKLKKWQLLEVKA